MSMLELFFYNLSKERFRYIHSQTYKKTEIIMSNNESSKNELQLLNLFIDSKVNFYQFFNKSMIWNYMDH